MLSPHPLCRFSALIRECLFASAAARLLSLAVTPSALPAAQRIGRPAGAELVGSLGLLKVPARDLKRALEEAAAVRADPPTPPARPEPKTPARCAAEPWLRLQPAVSCAGALQAPPTGNAAVVKVGPLPAPMLLP